MTKVVDLLAYNHSIIKDSAKLRLGGEYKNATVLFTDIKGFTSILENVEPNILTKFMKEYMTELTSSVLKNEGMLDKYIGGAIVALFGLPLGVFGCRSVGVK